MKYFRLLCTSIQCLEYDNCDMFILFMNFRPVSIFFGRGDRDKSECLLKNFMIEFPALLLRLCFVTRVIKSAYASFGNSLISTSDSTILSCKVKLLGSNSSRVLLILVSDFSV